MRVSFTGGAFDGCRLSITAPYTPRTLYVVPSPEAQLDVLVVGTERFPPGPLFTGVVEYVLDPGASELRPHPKYPEMEVGEAVYRCSP